MIRCDYCGTELADGASDITVPLESASGYPHHTTRCREYVFAALQATKRGVAELRAAVVNLRATIDDATDDLSAGNPATALQRLTGFR